jgi:hypothetical protein
MAERKTISDTEGTDRFIETISGSRAGMTQEVIK